MLEVIIIFMQYAASCGKVIDKNLVIVVLYNQACGY